MPRLAPSLAFLSRPQRLMTSAAPFRQSPHWMLALAGTAIAYAVVGWAALWLAIPPGYAAPLYPSAGIALACAFFTNPTRG